MALTQVTGPYPIFTDLDGTPLDDGYLYIGLINQDPEQNPIQVFWDANLTIPASQPIRTSNGYAYRNGTPALLYTGGAFSITIRNKREEFVLYSPVGYGFDPAAVSASVVKNDFVGDGVQVAFVLSAAPSTILATNAFINGVYQEKDSYTLAGNTITFSIAPPLSSSIEIMTNETGVINSTTAGFVSYNPANTYPSGSIGNFLDPFFGVSDAVFEVTTQAGVGLQRGITVEHYADTGGSYGIDIHQYQGAKNAFVVHCYSDENGAVAGAVAAQIDHTRSGNILVLKNAENPVTSPGTRGTANFLSFVGYGGSPQTTAKELGALTHQLTFLSYDPLFPYTFNGGLVAVAGTGHAQALKSTSLLDTLYAGEFYGTDKGVFVSTTNTNSGFNLGIVKNGAGSGTLMGLFNSGTGDFLIGYNGSAVEKSKIDSAGQYYVQGTRVLTVQQPFIADPAGGATVDTQARTAINSILDLLAAHGLMAPV